MKVFRVSFCLLLGISLILSVGVARADPEENSSRIQGLEADLVTEQIARGTGDQSVAATAQAANDSLQTLLEGQIAAEASLRSATDMDLDARLTTVEAYEDRIAALETQLTIALDIIAELQTSVAALDPNGELGELANHLIVDNSTINGLIGPHVIFEGANVHVQKGSSVPSVDGINGLGNLIIGYNKALPETDLFQRGGSHNLVVGRYHEYPSRNGFVAGRQNKITARDASVSGGKLNEAISTYSSVSGGYNNIAGGPDGTNWNASVSGGSFNRAEGDRSSVSGGFGNIASGAGASVTGGFINIANNIFATVTGGYGNTASGYSASVNGGWYNTASHDFATVSGGSYQFTTTNSEHVP